MLLLILLFTCLCYFLPGVLLHAWLRGRGLTLPVCLGLGLAGLIVLDVWVASIVGYRFPAQLSVNVIVVAVLGWRVRREIPAWLAWLRTQWPWPAVGWGAVAAIFVVPAFVVTLPSSLASAAVSGANSARSVRRTGAMETGVQVPS